jgi:hypothetical protein
MFALASRRLVLRTSSSSSPLSLRCLSSSCRSLSATRSAATIIAPAATGSSSRIGSSALSRRLFSSQSSKHKSAKPDDWFDRLQKAVKHVNERRTVYLMGSVVCLSGYAVSKISFNVMSFFSTLDFIWVAKISYFGGLATAAAMAGATVACMRLTGIRPEWAYRHALKRVSADPLVVNALGAKPRAGSFRAYSFDDPLTNASTTSATTAEFSSKFDSLTKNFRPRTLQLMFQLDATDGSGREAIVAAEMRNQRGTYMYDLLAVNVIDVSAAAPSLRQGLPENVEQRLVLDGDASKQIYFGATRLR